MLLSDFDAEQLFYTIPDFHNTRKRYEKLKADMASDPCSRVSEVRDELDWLLSMEDEACRLTDLFNAGKLPLRVTHNDTKINNVLFDEKSRDALVVIDLDTVMPGLAAYDFGDAIRFGASTALEDETDLDKVHFSLPYYRAFAEGYLEAFGSRLNEAELLSLPMGAKLMTLEVGIRFLGDYLNGDVYFKVDYPEHNLIRARTQLRLLQEMEEHWQEMNDIVRELGKGPKKA